MSGLSDSIFERTWRWGVRRTFGRLGRLTAERQDEAAKMAVASGLNRGRKVEVRVAMLDVRQLDNPHFRQPVETFRFQFVDGRLIDLPSGVEPDVVIGIDSVGASALATGTMDVGGTVRNVGPLELLASGRLFGPVQGKEPRLNDLLLVQSNLAGIRVRFGD
jgi:hypothetical protein